MDSIEKIRVRVAVVVGLELTDEAGGHVKCWERLAEAALKSNFPIDLTIFFHGRKKKTITISESVRYQIIPPVFSSRKFKFLNVGADYTDLAPIDPRLVWGLGKFDIIHSTDTAFCTGVSAKLSSKIWNKPLVTSVHTDVAGYTEFYAKRILHRSLAGVPRIARWLCEKYNLPKRFAQKVRRKSRAHMENCEWVFVGKSYNHDLMYLPKDIKNLSVLRRGIDRSVFKEIRTAKRSIKSQYQLQSDEYLISFAGRIDEAKGAVTAAQIVRELDKRGYKVKLFLAGTGDQSDLVKRIGGKNIILPGALPQSDLAVLLSASDLFLFPSKYEVSPNAVLEAKSCGVACVVSPEGGGKFIHKNGSDGVVISSDDVVVWVDSIANLLENPEKRQKIGRRGQQIVQLKEPDWDIVYAEDLCPAWLSVFDGQDGGVLKNDWKVHPGAISPS